jgi:hypothetical protein
VSEGAHNHAELPPPFDQIGERRFSFFPPVLNVEHNEWTVSGHTWSEVAVRNAKSGEEIWIPKRFVGEVSRVEEPVMILGLKRELEYKAGSVWPHERRVIEMPRSALTPPPASAAGPAAPEPEAPKGLALTANEGRIGRLILITLLGGIALCALLVSYFSGRNSGNQVSYQGILQAELGLSAADDFHAVERKLGPAARDRWLSEEGELQFRVLSYPERRFSVILMGRTRNGARYIGARDDSRRVIDSVELPGGVKTAPMIRNLRIE